MSLINDALKRASEAQQQAPPPSSPGPQFRPVEPGPRLSRFGLLLPFAGAAAALLGLFFAWEVLQKNDSPRTVEAKMQAAVGAAGVPTAPQRPPPEPARPSATQTTSEPVAQKEPAVTPPAVKEAPPKPAPLKLQAIVFNPARPSAIVSGRTLFIGDRIGELRVVAITQENIKLVGAGQTNVLSLVD